MANQYALSSTKIITAPNGIKITIYTDGDKKFVKLTNLYKALGFAGQFGLDTTFGLVFKNHRFTLFKKMTVDSPKAVNVVELNQVIPVLEAYIRISLITKSSLYQDLRDNARMEAQRLIEIFNREVFGKPDTVITKSAETLAPTVSKSENTDDKNSILVTQLKAPPYDNTISIYRNHGDFRVPAVDIVLALCDGNAIENRFRTLRHAAKKAAVLEKSIVIPEYSVLPGYSLCDIDRLLATFAKLEPSDAVEINAYTLQEFFDGLKLAPNVLSTTDLPATWQPNTNAKENTQMENFNSTDKPVQNTVPVVTVADIEDISARADATIKVYGVSKADALRAVTKLKAEEINRDLAPLLELLG